MRGQRLVGARCRAIGAVACFALGTSAALGDTVDPAVPSVIRVGTPAGMAPSSRGDAQRTGRTSTELPLSPSELWRRPFSTIEVSPIVDASGALIVATAAGDVIKLSSDGKEGWRAHLLGGGPSASPVLLSDGTIGVLTTGGAFTFLSSNGKVRSSITLGARGPDLTAAPVATDDGGVAVIAGRSLLTLDGDGTVTTETLLPTHASAPPIPHRHGWLVVADDGSVFRVAPPKQALRIGRFEGTVDGGAVLADERTLLAVMGERVLALDLKTGIVSTRASVASPAPIEGPIALTRDGTALFATGDGLLFGVDRRGDEQFRAVIEHVAPPSPPPYGYPTTMGMPTYGYRGDPPLLVDGAGHIAFLRAGGRLGIVDVPHATSGQDPTDPKNLPPSARVGVASEHVCATPLAVLPTGAKRIAVACREGMVVAYGE